MSAFSVDSHYNPDLAQLYFDSGIWLPRAQRDSLCNPQALSHNAKAQLPHVETLQLLKSQLTQQLDVVAHALALRRDAETKRRNTISLAASSRASAQTDAGDAKGGLQPSPSLGDVEPATLKLLNTPRPTTASKASAPMPVNGQRADQVIPHSVSGVQAMNLANASSPIHVTLQPSL